MYKLYLKGKGSKNHTFRYFIGQRKTMQGIKKLIDEATKNMSWSFGNDKTSEAGTPDWTVLLLFHEETLLSNIGV